MKQIKLYGRTVFVKDGNVDRALQKFKKKITDIGLLKELRSREFYEKPTSERKRKKNSARHRWIKKLESESFPKKMY